MKDKIINCQFSVFGDFTEITPERTEVTIELLKTLSEYNFTPTTFQEITENQIYNRIMLSNSDGWSVNIGTKRIDIAKGLTDFTKELDDLNKITNSTKEIIRLILKKFSKKANRIAFNIFVLLNKKDSESVSSLYSKKYPFGNFYNENKPYEWSIRSVSKISSSKFAEDFNAITEFIKTKGQLSNNLDVFNFDQVVLHFDINTLQNVSDNRFEISLIVEFWNLAIETYKGLENEIKGMIMNESK